MQKRNYKRVELVDNDTYKIKTIAIESYDTFEENLEIIVTEISNLVRIGDILKQLNLASDSTYFFHQCRDVISVSEKHINEKGQGNFTFQANFHNFPDSALSINKDALVVIVIHPKKTKNEKGELEYNIVGYIHVNQIDVMHNDIRYDGYYYNMLRISERVENNQKIYRRKKIFTLMFSIMHSIVGVEENIAFTYGAMGKENQAINEALELNTKLYDKHYEKWPFYNNTLINKVFGSKDAFTKIVDITNDKEKLKSFYQMLKQQKSNYAFYHMHTEEDFFITLNKIFSYSKSSKVFMVADKNGNIAAACLAINWGDYFSLELENPQGLFKMLAKMNLTKNILYPIMIVGEANAADTLLRGIAHYYAKNHKCKVTVLNSYDGDPYYKTKDSLLKDDYLFLIICNDKQILEAIKDKSRGIDGNVKLYIDIPLL